MTPGQQALLAAIVFFATLHAITWALTLPAGTQFALGAGWLLVVQRVMAWADTEVR